MPCISPGVPRPKLLFGFLCTSLLCAQGGDVSGTVLDPSGAPVAGISVALKGAKENTPSVITDEDGVFRFPAPGPGSYEVTIAQPPFQTKVIPVRVGRNIAPTPLQVVLQLSEVRDEITVTDQSPTVSTQPTDNLTAVEIDSDMIRGLPILGGDYLSVLSELTGGAGSDGAATIILDGREVDARTVPASAIAQIKINRDPYTAEFGRPGRGRIEITTRQGTQDFHGSFEIGLRNSRLDARNAFASVRPKEDRRLFSGFLTGPLDRSGRTSFSFAFERENENLQSLIFAQSPSGLLQQQVRSPEAETDLTLRIRRLVGEKHVFSLGIDREAGSAENQGVGGFALPEVATMQSEKEQEVEFHHTAFVSPNLISDLSLSWETSRESEWSVASGVRRLVVADAFTSGGAQVDSRQSEDEFGLKYVASWSKGRHLLRAGVDVPEWNRQTSADRSNRDGTFYFSDLAEFAAGRPYSFVQQSGNSDVRLRRRVVGLFVQDTIQLRPGLTVGLGLRYDRENYTGDANNLAPRVSIAYAPSQKDVVRAGFGIFYDRLNSGLVQDFLLFGGNGLNRLILTNPSYPDPFAASTAALIPPPIRVLPAADLRSPYLTHYSLSWERRLFERTSLTMTYTRQRGVSLFRSRDVNAPMPGTFLRPMPEVGLVRQVESSGTMKNQSLEIGVNGRITKFFTGTMRYEYGRVHSNTDGPGTLPANSYNIESEWSRSNRDRRHSLRGLGTFDVNGWFETGFVLSVNSGAPYSLTTGNDDNRDGLGGDRPAGVPRNSLEGPGSLRLDLRWSKEIALLPSKADADGPKLQATVDAFNVLNRVNYSGFVGNLSSPFFGQPVAAQAARRLQLGLRFSF